jgi:ATP-dependent Clp protease ATP-binding subunit ClpX
MDHVQLTFTDEALDYIVDKAIEYKLGARGLRSLTESVIMDYMYSIPSEKVEQLEITREIVAEKLTKNINA